VPEYPGATAGRSVTRAATCARTGSRRSRSPRSSSYPASAWGCPGREVNGAPSCPPARLDITGLVERGVCSSAGHAWRSCAAWIRAVSAPLPLSTDAGVAQAPIACRRTPATRPDQACARRLSRRPLMKDKEERASVRVAYRACSDSSISVTAEASTPATWSAVCVAEQQSGRAPRLIDRVRQRRPGSRSDASGSGARPGTSLVSQTAAPTHSAGAVKAPAPAPGERGSSARAASGGVERRLLAHARRRDRAALADGATGPPRPPSDERGDRRHQDRGHDERGDEDPEGHREAGLA
jgi:hypothetical protein